MITKEERKALDAASKNYEVGLRRFYKGHVLEDRIADYVARFRASWRLVLERKKEKEKQAKEKGNGRDIDSSR